MKRLAVVALSLLPGACHFTWSGPFLYSHHSSAAFEIWALMWTGCIVLVVGAMCVDLKDPLPQHSSLTEKP